MDNHFQAKEKELRSLLIQSKHAKMQVKPYTGLYVEYNAVTDRLTYILKYRKPKDHKPTDRRYSGLNLEEVVTGKYQSDRTLLKKKIDPREAEQEARTKALEIENQRKKQKITFEDVYLQWKDMAQKKKLSKYDISTVDGYKAIRNMTRNFQRFEKHILPLLAKTSVYSINSYHLTEIFQPLYSEQYATANKCATVLKKVFAWYEQDTKGEFKTPITLSFATNLSDSKKEGARKTKNFNAPDYRALPVIFSRLNSERYEGNTSALVAQFCILTACRNQAVRNLQWENVHLNEDSTGYFIIPDEDNKIKGAPKELRTVYFGSLVGVLLENLKDERQGNSPSLKFVFPNKYRKDWRENPRPLSENAANTFMRKAFHVNELKEGYFWKDADNEKVGLIQTHATSRACFQTWALEQKDNKTGLPRYSKELTEACLLHAKADQYKGAYDRSRVSEEELYRIKGDWEEYIFSYELACSKILPVLDNPIAMGNLRDEEAEIEQLEKQDQSIQESEDLKSYRIYERGLIALTKAQDDFKKYGGAELLRKLEKQKEK